MSYWGRSGGRAGSNSVSSSNANKGRGGSTQGGGFLQERIKEMSAQEKLIEQKKKEIEAKLLEQKQKEQEKVLSKLQSKATAKVSLSKYVMRNIFGACCR